MYICVENISAEELQKINSAIKEIVNDDAEIRTIGSIYREIAKTEIECTIDSEIDEEQIENLSDEQYRTIVEDLTDDLLGECENTVFQELCDISRDVISNYATTDEEILLFKTEYLENICN